jgi:hypothetical protein
VATTSFSTSVGGGRAVGGRKGGNKSSNFDSEDEDEDEDRTDTWSRGRKEPFIREKSRIMFTVDALTCFCSISQCFLLLKAKSVKLTVLTDLLKKKELIPRNQSPGTALIVSSDTMLTLAESLVKVEPSHEILQVKGRERK